MDEQFDEEMKVIKEPYCTLYPMITDSKFRMDILKEILRKSERFNVNQRDCIPKQIYYFCYKCEDGDKYAEMRIHADCLQNGEAYDILCEIGDLEADIKGVEVTFTLIQPSCVYATIAGDYYHTLGALHVLVEKGWELTEID